MNRPRVTLKLATSLDGRIATASGESRWITSEASRAEVQKMRAAHDAVMVGIGTVLVDDPELLARTEPPPPHQPVRIVMDRRFRTPVSSKLAQATDHRHRVIIVSTGGWPIPTPSYPGKGVELLMAAPAKGEGEIATALRALGQHNKMTSILLEGGGELAAAFLREALVDRLEWFRAPIVLGAEGRPAVGALALARLAEAPTWNRVALRELGPDLWESYERA